MKGVIQSYKQVKNVAPTSRAAATNHTSALVTGVDNWSGPGGSQSEVPTGAIVKFIEIEFSCVNLVSVASFLHYAIEHLRSGQSVIAPNAVGGNAIRNQVHLQGMLVLGADQNNNRKIRFKIPKKFQRVREGDTWNFVRTCDTVFTDAVQIIYKFYR